MTQQNCRTNPKMMPDKVQRRDPNKIAHMQIIMIIIIALAMLLWKFFFGLDRELPLCHLFFS
jgi:hypothetical protein